MASFLGELLRAVPGTILAGHKGLEVGRIQRRKEGQEDEDRAREQLESMIRRSFTQAETENRRAQAQTEPYRRSVLAGQAEESLADAEYRRALANRPPPAPRPVRDPVADYQAMQEYDRKHRVGKFKPDAPKGPLQLGAVSKRMADELDAALGDVDTAGALVAANAKAFGLGNMLPSGTVPVFSGIARNLRDRGNQGNVQARQAVGNIKGLISNLRGGKTITANEMAVLVDMIPDVTESPQAITTKIKGIQDFLKRKRSSIGNSVEGPDQRPSAPDPSDEDLDAALEQVRQSGEP